MSRAIELERQALAICERLPNPADRAISHGNLSNYLHQVGQIEEGARQIDESILSTTNREYNGSEK